jgi:hypothetical protein
MMSRWIAAAVFAVVAPAIVSGQDSPPADSMRMIRGVEIRRHDIFSPSEANGLLPRLANGLHFVTRAWVVRRELLFRPGEPYDSAAVAETARNLRGLSIFRAVTIDSVRTDSGLVVRVTTADGWSTRPITYFQNVGSSLRPTIGIEELNFLGTATLVSLRYTSDPDRSTVTTSFRQPRLFAGRVGLAFQYSHLSDGDLTFAQLSKPFFTLSGRTSWSIYGDSRDQRVLRFFDGSDTASITLQRRYKIAGAAAAWAIRAGSKGYFRVGVTGQIRRDDYAAETRLDTLRRTVTGAAGVYLQWRRAHFLVSRGLEGFAREEDIDVSTAVGFGLTAAPRAFGYPDDGIVPFLALLTGFGQPNRFVQFFATTSGRFTAAGLDSGSTHLAATAFLLPAPRHLMVLHAAAGWQQGAAPGAEFDLGLGIGPRAFRQHAFTGDRAIFTSAEYRWTATNDFLKLTAIGLAGFADYGGAWYHGKRRRTGWDAGIGLRFGPTRATDIQSSRVDLAYRGKSDVQPGGWVLVVGKGFAFSLNGRLDR